MMPSCGAGRPAALREEPERAFEQMFVHDEEAQCRAPPKRDRPSASDAYDDLRRAMSADFVQIDISLIISAS